MLCKKSKGRRDTVSTKTVRGRITHCDDRGRIYLSIKADHKLDRSVIENCLAKLNNSYSMESNYHRNYLYLQEIEYKVGEVYAAVYGPDRLFYRARIVRELDYNRVLVSYIDYGNREVIPRADLAPLPQEVAGIEAMVMVCVLPGVRVVDKEGFAVVVEELSGREVEVGVEGRCLEGRGGLWEDLEEEEGDGEPLWLIAIQHRGKSLSSVLLDRRAAVAVEEDFRVPLDDSCLPPSKAPSSQTTRDKCPSLCTEYAKTVIVIHVNSGGEFFVHEFSKEVKNRLEYLQLVIARVVDRYRSQVADNFFNKRNIYLSQFNEDKLWYRCRITNFDTKKGFLVEFLDFGNHEYKESLSDLILLTADMGDDASYLMHEDPVSHKCQLAPPLLAAFPPDANIKKYLTKRFVDPAKKVVINYLIKEDLEVVWLITNLLYHEKGLLDLVQLEFILPDSPQKRRNGDDHKDHNNDRDNGRGKEEEREEVHSLSESVASSHSVHDAADVKVADYLLNGCAEGPGDRSQTPSEEERPCLVTHVGGLHDLWIDVGDGQTREMLANLLAATCAFSGASPVSEVLVGGLYGLRTEAGRALRARVEGEGAAGDGVLVRLVDVGGRCARASLDDLFALGAEAAALPQRVLPFRLGAGLRLCEGDGQEEALSRLRALLEGRPVRLVREAPRSLALVDLVLDGNRSLVQALLATRVACLLDEPGWFRPRRCCGHRCPNSDHNHIPPPPVSTPPQSQAQAPPGLHPLGSP